MVAEEETDEKSIIPKWRLIAIKDWGVIKNHDLFKKDKADYEIPDGELDDENSENDEEQGLERK